MMNNWGGQWFMDKIDLGWGHTPLISKVLVETYGDSIWPSPANYIFGYDYLEYGGHHKVIENIKNFYKTHLHIDLSDFHVVLTEGASMALYLLGELAYKIGIANINLPTVHFIKTPELLNDLGNRKFKFYHSESVIFGDDPLVLVELPSNPLGFLSTDKINSEYKVAVDLAYFTPTYIGYAHVQNHGKKIEQANFIIGSFGKMTGFNNLRIGFLAIKNQDYYHVVKKSIAHKTLGPSGLSQFIIMSFLNQDPSEFFSKSQTLLSENRSILIEAAQKKGIEVVSNRGAGMFVVFAVDHALKTRLEKRITFMYYDNWMSRSVDSVHIRLNAAKQRHEIEMAYDLIINA